MHTSCKTSWVQEAFKNGWKVLFMRNIVGIFFIAITVLSIVLHTTWNQLLVILLTKLLPVFGFSHISLSFIAMKNLICGNDFTKHTLVIYDLVLRFMAFTKVRLLNCIIRVPMQKLASQMSTVLGSSVVNGWYCNWHWAWIWHNDLISYRWLRNARPCQTNLDQ